MAYTKPQVYNIALSAMLLAKKVVDPVTDKSTEVAVLNTYWDIALESTLKDLDLDILSQPYNLELIEEIPTGERGPWVYAYKYPATCAFLRRIDSGHIVDNYRTHIPKRVAVYTSTALGTTQKAILTNQADAVAEMIPNDMSLNFFSVNAIMALAYKLAGLCTPLIVGKGSKPLIEMIDSKYKMFKTEAQEDDRAENFNYEDDNVRSEFVDARTE